MSEMSGRMRKIRCCAPLLRVVGLRGHHARLDELEQRRRERQQGQPNSPGRTMRRSRAGWRAGRPGRTRGRCSIAAARQPGNRRVDARRERVRRVVALDGHDRLPEDREHRADVGCGEALAEDLVHREQQEHLEHGRQAARGRVHAALLVELHLLFRDLGAVALVLGLDRLASRAGHLHPPLGHDLRRNRGSRSGRMRMVSAMMAMPMSPNRL